MQPDVEWQTYLVPGPGGATYCGCDGVRELWSDVRNVFAGYRNDPEQLFDLGDKVVSFICISGRGSRSGVDVEARIAHVFTFRDGKILRVESFEDRDEALNVEVVRAIYDALLGGRVPFELLDDDMHMDLSERIFNPATYEGLEGVERFLREVQEVWEEWVTEPEEFRAAGEHVVAFVRSRGRGRGSGVEVEDTSANLWQVRDGKALSYKLYREPADALRAAGISE